MTPPMAIDTQISPPKPKTGTHKVLVIDDDPIIAESLAEFLSREGYEASTAFDAAEAMEALAEAEQHTDGPSRVPHPFDLAICDVSMPGMGGMELLQHIQKEHDAAVIMLTGYGTIESAVEALRLGASDYLTKPVVDSELRVSLERALRQHKLLSENRRLKQELSGRYGLEGIVGRDHRVQRIFELIEAVAPSRTTVLMTGESGVGKSRIARAIHQNSPRRDEPFVEISCGSIPETLLESELFGHVKGAFTGAHADKAGRFLAADGGTLFLDEIGEMDLMLQSKLLRFLQTGTFQRLGDTQSRQVDARIICATNRNPVAEITAGRFREDLYYRLHVLPVHLPPLRERRDDILPLAEAFLTRYATEERRSFKGFDADAEARILSYGWPGNVRQLENTVRQIVVMNEGAAVTFDMLPMVIRDQSGRPNAVIDLSRERSRVSVPSRPFGAIEPLWAQERKIIEDALDAFDGNIAMAAAALEISPSTIYRKRQSWTARSI